MDRVVAKLTKEGRMGVRWFQWWATSRQRRTEILGSVWRSSVLGVKSVEKVLEV